MAARNQPLIDINMGQAPLFYRGDDVEIDIGIGENGALLAPTLSNILSVTCQVFAKQNDASAPLMSGTASAAAMNLGLTAAQWSGNTAPYFHAGFIFPNSQTYISLGGAPSQNYWLRMTLATADGKMFTLADGTITVLDGPVNGSAAPAITGNARTWTDGSGNLVLQIRNDSDGKYYTVGIENNNGVPSLYLGDIGN